MKFRSAILVATLALGAANGCDRSGEVDASPETTEVRTVVLAIEGMHCEACVKAIEGKLTKMDGVRTASVSLADERVTIEAQGSVSEAALEATIDKLGYDASAVSNPTPSS